MSFMDGPLYNLSDDMKIISDAMKIISLKLLKLSFRYCETYISNRSLSLRQLMCGHLMNICGDMAVKLKCIDVITIVLRRL